MYVPFSVSCVLFVCKCVVLSPGVNSIAVKYISYFLYGSEIWTLRKRGKNE
jgi:hypothetical protein